MQEVDVGELLGLTRGGGGQVGEGSRNEQGRVLTSNAASSETAHLLGSSEPWMASQHCPELK